MTKSAILVDSACSLPRQICDKYDVSFVKVKYTVNDTTKIDPVNEREVVALFDSGQFGGKYDVDTAAPLPEDFEAAIIEKAKQGFDRIIVQTVNRTQGETYANANAAVSRVREKLAGKNITVRVMDSRTVFAGQGLMAVETIRRLRKESNEDQARRKMDVLSEKIHTFIIPRDIVVARKRGVKRNEHNVSWTQAMVAGTLGIHPVICNVNDSSYVPKKIWGFEKAAQSLFQHACSRIEAGLLSPVITINYAGSINALKTLPGYDALSQLAKDKKLLLVPSVASICNGIYASVGSLSLAMATEPHEWS